LPKAGAVVSVGRSTTLVTSIPDEIDRLIAKGDSLSDKEKEQLNKLRNFIAKKVSSTQDQLDQLKVLFEIKNDQLKKEQDSINIKVEEERRSFADALNKLDADRVAYDLQMQKINDELKELEKTSQQAAKPNPEFAEDPDKLAELEKQKAEIEGKQNDKNQELAELKRRQAESENEYRATQVKIEQINRSLAAEKDQLQARFNETLTPLSKEIEIKTKELVALKNFMGYSLITPIDSDLIERSLLLVPKSGSSVAFGVPSTIEFGPYEGPYNFRAPGTKLTPYRPRMSATAGL